MGSQAQPGAGTSAGGAPVTHRIALIPGDGIGQEVVPPAQRVLEEVGRTHGFGFAWTELDWSCERYAREGAMMPADGIELLREHDQVFLGAVGFPGVPDHVSLWGLLIPIRRAFQQYVNLRPVKLLRGLHEPAARRRRLIDMLVVRENSEGEYSELGGRFGRGTAGRVRRAGVGLHPHGRRAGHPLRPRARRGGGPAGWRRRRSPTGSSTRCRSGTRWSASRSPRGPASSCPSTTSTRSRRCSSSTPGASTSSSRSNLFGDILTDIGGAVMGSIGIAPSANLNPEGEFPSMFEPVHGSAPDIAGQGRANPLGQVWSGAMMLDHLGHPEAAAAVMAAMESVLADTGVRTADLGGTASTDEVTDELLRALRAAG